MTNRQWLLENSGAPIKYCLDKTEANAELLLHNGEAAAWFSRLTERSLADNIGDIHGSHDYRMENILGKCWILGFSKDVPAFNEKMEFILRFLARHVQSIPPNELSFGKIYHFRDYEKVLSCFLPFLGYGEDPAVLGIARRRIDVLHRFALRKRYDIYVDGSKLKGVKKIWQPFILDPDLYADGHIALPDAHDFLLFAGLLPYLSSGDREKVEIVVGWLFDGGYGGVIRRYGYFYIPGGSYNAKAVIFKMHLPDFREKDFDTGELTPLLFNMFVLSHFKTARDSEWFSMALSYLDRYKNDNGRYEFPSRLITEKPDSYVIFGGHMNVGENKKSKLYTEILSTYWMEKITEIISRQ